jgi:hypothetical protein
MKHRHPVIGSARPRDGLRTPRTLEEACGPGARLEIERADRWDRIIGRGCVVLFILALALLWAEHITGGMLP